MDNLNDELDKIKGAFNNLKLVKQLEYFITVSTQLLEQISVAMTILKQIEEHFPHILKEFASDEQLKLLSEPVKILREKSDLEEV